jgi:exonuclease III
MIVVSWNCRGPRIKYKMEAISDLMRSKHPNVLLIQETKLLDTQIMEVGKTQCRGSEEALTNSKGASRGICTPSNNEILEENQIIFSQRSIYTDLVCRKTSMHFNIFNMYATMQYREKQECWCTLEEMKNKFEIEF